MSASEPFTCIQCGACCKGYGGTYLTDDDIKIIARHLSISAQELLRKYCTLSGQKPLIVQGGDGYCVFFDQNCTIHAVKPQMCRNWPYIDSLLVDLDNWYIMAASCPGMRTDWPDRKLSDFVQAKIAARKLQMRHPVQNPESRGDR